MRTDQEIVDQTNELAIVALRYIGTGYEAPEGFKVYDHLEPPNFIDPPRKASLARHFVFADDKGMTDAKIYARSQKAWAFACEVQDLMTATDPNDALSNLEGTTE